MSIQSNYTNISNNFFKKNSISKSNTFNEDHQFQRFLSNNNKSDTAIFKNNFNILNRDETSGIFIIIKQLEKFKTIYMNTFKYKNKYNLKTIIKYFNELVANPSLFTIYKILYYSVSVTAKIKYIIYKIVYLFMNCELFLIEEILKNLNYNTINNSFDIKFNNSISDICSLLETYININNVHSNECIEDILLLNHDIDSNNLIKNCDVTRKVERYYNKLIYVKKSLIKDISLINSPNFEQLDLSSVLDMWHRYISDYKQIYIYLNSNYIKFKKQNKEGEKLISDTKSNNNVNKVFDQLLSKKTLSKIKETNIDTTLFLENLLNSLYNSNNCESAYDNTLNKHNKYIDNNNNNNESKINIHNNLIEFAQLYKERKEDLSPESNVLVSIFEDNKDIENKEIKKLIAFDLLHKLINEDFFNKSLSLYDENDTILINIINTLFITDPELFQNLIQNNASMVKNCIFHYIQKQTFFLSQLSIIEFSRLDLDKNNKCINNLINIFEFLRLFCENHHKIYQSIIINTKIISTDISENYINVCSDEDKEQEKLDFVNLKFIDYLLIIATSILESINQFNDKKQYITIFKEKYLIDFDDLILKVFDLLIEMYQGSLSFNFNILSNNKIFIKFCDISYKYLEYTENEEDYEFYFAHFFRFINTFMEEITNDYSNKFNIIKRFNPKKLLSICQHCFKKLYYEQIIKAEDNNKFIELLKKFSIEVVNSNISQKEIEKQEENIVYILNNDLSNIPELKNFAFNDENTSYHEALLNYYLENQELKDNKLFILLTGILMYFKNSYQYKQVSIKTIKIIDNMEEIAMNKVKLNINDKNKNNQIMKKELYNLYNKIIKDVEISYKFKDLIEDYELNKYKELFEETLVINSSIFNNNEINNSSNNINRIDNSKKSDENINNNNNNNNNNDNDNLENNNSNNNNKNKNNKNENENENSNFKYFFNFNNKNANQENISNSLFNNISSQLKIVNTGIQKINFIVNIDSLFLDNKDINSFYELAPYDDFNLKLDYILKYYNNNISDIIEVRKKLWGYKISTLKLLYGVNYKIMTIISVFMCFIINFLLFLGLSYYNEKVYHHASYEDKIMGQANDWEEFKTLKKFKYHKITNIISIIHIVFCFLIILNFICFEYYKYINSKRQSEFKSLIDNSNIYYEDCNINDDNNNKDIDIINKYNLEKFKNIKAKNILSKISNKLDYILKNLKAFFKILISEEIKILFFNMILGIIAVIGQKSTFYWYSFQLISIFSFFPTMQSVVISVKSRYKQFLSAALLIIIMILFYSSISFFLFNTEFYNEEINQNNCDSLLHCFLYLMNYGIRSGSLGLPIKKIEEDSYWSEFIFDWLFYFMIILIMLNIVNGIIVDTFQALREENNTKQRIRDNVCYICSINKAKFEMKGIDYNYHLNKEHCILNYFHYILKILRTDEQDLNSMDYAVFKAISKESTEFFPVKRAISLE